MRRHLAAQPISGLTVAAYCDQQHLSISTFYYWRKRLRVVEPTNDIVNDGFCQLQPTGVKPQPSPRSGPRPVVLHLGQNVKVELADYSPSDLATLLVHLESFVDA